MTATSLLLPLWAAAESHVQAGVVSGKSSATARVDFKIVVPKVLALGVAGGDSHGWGVQRVAIFSNSRNVTLAASSAALPAARNNVILTAAARKTIAREAACRLPADASRGAASKTSGMVCTVAMP
jgi:hypothetical protein